ncbi:MAG TPA: aldo/keto reductase [Pedobacter sp.]|uniref:aldo/keto reductase n=1 Tax=Pedobacter sp. TaxID=1411316 RepID=UPI002D17ACFE|nr:aldo/keto reductase [Pedobacter sp.]HMI02101.1 aldo/keto reductase [Pedobacter sp.]
MSLEGISRIGLGCVTFGREIDAAASFKMMDHARNNGVTFFDTAAAYSNGASETIVGKWLRSRGAASLSIVISTKVLPPFAPENLALSVNGSLMRLGTEAIDVLFLHRWDSSLESVETLKALDGLLCSGKVRALGASNFTLGQLRNIVSIQKNHGLAAFSYVQNNHNLAVSDIGIAFEQFCILNNIDIITYSPLGAGFLTGKHQNGIYPGSRFDLITGHQDVYFNEKAQRRLHQLLLIAGKTGYNPVHLALAWALHQLAVTSVLIGGRTTAHLDQAFLALNFDDPDIFAELESV